MSENTRRVALCGIIFFGVACVALGCTRSFPLPLDARGDTLGAAASARALADDWPAVGGGLTLATPGPGDDALLSRWRALTGSGLVSQADALQIMADLQSKTGFRSSTIAAMRSAAQTSRARAEDFRAMRLRLVDGVALDRWQVRLDAHAAIMETLAGKLPTAETEEKK